MSPLFWVVVAVVVGGWLYRKRERRAKLPRFPGERIAAATPTTLGAAPAGVDVQLEVTVAALDADAPLLRAPLTGRPCIAWRITCEASIGSANSPNGPSGEWEHRVTEESGNAIRLRDGNDGGVAQLAGALWDLESYGETLTYELDLSEPTRAFLARNRIDWSGYFKPLLRLEEQALEAGRRVIIFGRNGARGPRAAGGDPYRDAPSSEPLFATRADCPLVLMALPAPDDAGEPDDDEI